MSMIPVHINTCLRVSGGHRIIEIQLLKTSKAYGAWEYLEKSRFGSFVQLEVDISKSDWFLVLKRKKKLFFL